MKISVILFRPVFTQDVLGKMIQLRNFCVSITTCFYLPATLFEAPSTNNPTFDWMNSISERHAPSPIGYFWYLATLTGGTWENRAERRGSIRHAMGSEGWNRLYSCRTGGCGIEADDFCRLLEFPWFCSNDACYKKECKILLSLLYMYFI